MPTKTTVSKLKIGDRYVLKKADIPSWRTVKKIRKMADGRIKIDHDNDTWFGWHHVKSRKRCYVP